MKNKIEAIVDAISSLNSASDPESEAYKLRNPLLLKSWAQPGKHETDEDGRRIFSGFVNGYKAAVFDVTLKISGKSRANIKSTGTLRQLLNCYELRSPEVVEHVVDFIKRATNDNTINASTLVSYFLE